MTSTSTDVETVRSRVAELVAGGETPDLYCDISAVRDDMLTLLAEIDTLGAAYVRACARAARASTTLKRVLRDIRWARAAIADDDLVSAGRLLSGAVERDPAPVALTQGEVEALSRQPGAAVVDRRGVVWQNVVVEHASGSKESQWWPAWRTFTRADTDSLVADHGPLYPVIVSLARQEEEQCS